MIEPKSFWGLLNTAMNPKTSHETLETLALSNDYCIRERVARNPNTPFETLNVLVWDSHFYCQFLAIINPNSEKYHNIYLHYEEYFIL